MTTTGYCFLHVALGLPVRDPFTYKVDRSLLPLAPLGCRVLVPVQRRTVIGYIVGVDVPLGDVPAHTVREAERILDDEPVMDDVLLSVTRWMSQYYCSSWGEAIENALPWHVKHTRKWVDEIVLRNEPPAASEPLGATKPATVPALVLNAEQRNAVMLIEGSLNARDGGRFLLFGVTGSGKTEVYVRSIRAALEHGRTAICLFPEIALTRHLEEYFYRHFGAMLAVLHSRMTNVEKFRAWRAIRAGDKQVVIGPRSALFAPVRNLGIIIIDEEHEHTYKQNETPRYHAKMVALERARLARATIILGGATPSLETMYETERGLFRLITLTKRVVERPMPVVRVVDLKHDAPPIGRVRLVPYLRQRIEHALAAHEGVLLFLNRRGFATHISCSACGSIIHCSHCSVPVTYHASKRMLLCHYCDRSQPVPERCPSCGERKIEFGGTGTERVESVLARLFPRARIERLDTDRVRTKGEHERILELFKNREIDILVGTQMITKGFDFPHVTLVGIINADTALALPDFRSSERTFQLLAQVAGRAGRGDMPGEVIVQTYMPEQYAIVAAARHDYMALYHEELSRRRAVQYPPFTRMINIIMRGKDEKRVATYAETVKETLAAVITQCQLVMMGPAPLPFYYLHGYYRWHMMLKGSVTTTVTERVRTALEPMKRMRSCQFCIDVDPVNIL